MNENELNHMLKRAASAVPLPHTLEGEIMARVRADDGRARRWRSFVQWLLIIAVVSGIITAFMVGWSMARSDTTHSVPPAMGLFREGVPK